MRFVVVFFCFFLADLAFPLDHLPSVRRVNEPFLMKREKFYSLLQVVHANRSFIESNSRLNTDPAITSQLRLGIKVNGGVFDLWARWGFEKTSQNNRVDQLRPLVGADYYVLEGKYGQFLFFNRVLTPFTASEEQLSNKESHVSEVSFGTEYSPGIFVSATAPTSLGSWILDAEVLARAWTRLFSRNQLQNENDTLSTVTSSVYNSSMLERYGRAGLGIYLSPSKRKQLLISLEGFVDGKEIPSNSEQDSYNFAKTSLYVFRFSYSATKRLTLRNEFVRNYTGVFSQHGVEGRPIYSNLLKVFYKF